MLIHKKKERQSAGAIKSTFGEPTHGFHNSRHNTTPRILFETDGHKCVKSDALQGSSTQSLSRNIKVAMTLGTPIKSKMCPTQINKSTFWMVTSSSLDAFCNGKHPANESFHCKFLSKTRRPLLETGIDLVVICVPCLYEWPACATLGVGGDYLVLHALSLCRHACQMDAS